jgi:hypothetical protein
LYIDTSISYTEKTDKIFWIDTSDHRFNLINYIYFLYKWEILIKILIELSDIRGFFKDIKDDSSGEKTKNYNIFS